MSPDDVFQMDDSHDEKKIGVEDANGIHSDDDSLKGEDVLALQDLDPVLNRKMHLVNNAIDEIGWTPYHWKLFVLNGFGYVDMSFQQ
jgi:hypothetical protein